MPSRAALAACACLAVAGVAGCGNDKQDPPDVTTAGPPLGSSPARYPTQGIEFKAPSGWKLNTGDPPVVTTVSTGKATIAIYRYPRNEPLPKDKAAMLNALDALEGAAKTRDPTFKTIARGRLEVDGNPAVQLRGTETVNNQPKTVRSTHVYVDGAEVVIDAFAPSDQFKRVDAQAFRGVLRSLKISPPKS